MIIRYLLIPTMGEKADLDDGGERNAELDKVLYLA
jgi:hypothetical protein